MADDPVEWDDPVMAAIAKLGDDLRGEIVTSRTEVVARLDRLQASLDAILRVSPRSSGRSGYTGDEPRPWRDQAIAEAMMAEGIKLSHVGVQNVLAAATSKQAAV
jgi:hypothetical protein